MYVKPILVTLQRDTATRAFLSMIFRTIPKGRFPFHNDTPIRSTKNNKKHFSLLWPKCQCT